MFTTLSKTVPLGIVPVVLHHTTVYDISTIQLNLPDRFRDLNTHKVVQQMYTEVLKKFDYGKELRILDPIEDMEIEYNENEDDLDINELTKAKEKVREELLNPQLSKLSEANQDLYE